MGREERLARIKDRDSLISYIKETTNRTDLVFGEVVWLTDFK